MTDALARGSAASALHSASRRGWSRAARRHTEDPGGPPSPPARTPEVAGVPGGRVRWGPRLFQTDGPSYGPPLSEKITTVQGSRNLLPCAVVFQRRRLRHVLGKLGLGLSEDQTKEDVTAQTTCHVLEGRGAHLPSVGEV